MTEDTKIEALENRVTQIEKEMIEMKVRLDGVHSFIAELKKYVQEGFTDLSNKILKGMGFIIGILLSIIGVLIYTYIMK